MKNMYKLLIVLLIISCKNNQRQQVIENPIVLKKTKSCNCIDKENTDSIRNINFGFKGKLSFFYKEGIIRKIKAKTVKKLYYDIAVNEDSLKAFIKAPKYYERFLCFNSNNQLEGKEGFLYDDNFITICFDSGNEFVKSSTGIKKGANSGTNWDYNYSLNLLESYIYMSKINYDKFPTSLKKYTGIFNREGNELVLGQEKREIGRKKPFGIYNKKTFSEIEKRLKKD